MEGQSLEQQMCFPLGMAHACHLGRSHTCFQSAPAPSYFCDIGPQLLYVEWQGLTGGGARHDAKGWEMLRRVGRARAGLQWGPKWP